MSDLIAPQIAITSPVAVDEFSTPGAHSTSVKTLRISGTVTDETSIPANITLSCVFNAAVHAVTNVGNGTWYADVVLQPGLNEFRIGGHDEAFNSATTIDLNITAMPVEREFPADGASNVPLNPILSVGVQGGDASGIAIFKFYLGENETPSLVWQSRSNQFQSAHLKPNTTYYWKVAMVDTDETEFASAVYSFTTGKHLNLPSPGRLAR